jgi:hypothetical protein
MNGYYYVVNTIKEYLKNTGVINTVTIGDIFKVDLNKQTIFPLSHIIVNNAELAENTTTLNLSILFMDLVDESKAEVTDIWDGNDNEQDVLNTQLALGSRLTSALMRGSLFSDLVQVVTATNAEPFIDRFENKLAGWTLTFDVMIPNNMTIC